MNQDIVKYEYELIDMSFGMNYEIPEDISLWLIQEDNVITDESEEEPQIEYDADGIPLGTSQKEYEKRQQIITDFLHKWGDEHPERRILNEALHDYIHIKGISLIEAKEHSAKRYKSTRAVMILEEVLKNALPVGRVPIKKGNKNQEPFAYMLIMVYRHSDYGTIKLTVGVKASEQRIQYGLTALESGQPLIDKSLKKTNSKKKRSPHK